jgi:hypothetical protein
MTRKWRGQRAAGSKEIFSDSMALVRGRIKEGTVKGVKLLFEHGDWIVVRCSVVGVRMSGVAVKMCTPALSANYLIKDR